MAGLQRKTPLRSKTPLKSYSRLNPGQGLSRGASSLKRSPLQSKKSLKAPAPSTKSPEEVRGREVVSSRSQGLCEICGSRVATDMAHRLPRSGGGGWEAYNILHTCRQCHRWNHDNPSEAFKSGQHVRRHYEPASVPVKYRGKWVLLDEGGGVHDFDLSVL